MIGAGYLGLTHAVCLAELGHDVLAVDTDARLSFINALAEVCEATGADVAALAGALGYDERIGGRFLTPGLGYGGGCLPRTSAPSARSRPSSA